jgi:tRNA-Thr(GGU) m(6)t(6)A37 methyltransferase TsaA
MNHEWQEPVTIRPIGVVVSGLKDFHQIPSYQEESAIVVREDLAEGLIGLEHFSHIHVIYYQHRQQAWKEFAKLPAEQPVLTMPLMGEPSCKGIYTSRSPARPSRMGSCIVELLAREGNRLRVRGLDAIDGTPVLDIKIYIPRYDAFPLADAPLHWCQKTELVTTSRLLHWDTVNVGFTLGMRAGKRAMEELGVGRGDRKRAQVAGGNFFAQGVEAVTGCSVLQGSMSFEEKPKSLADWVLCLRNGGRSATVRLCDKLYSGADEVLALPDEVLFAAVEPDSSRSDD